MKKIPVMIYHSNSPWNILEGNKQFQKLFTLKIFIVMQFVMSKANTQQGKTKYLRIGDGCVKYGLPQVYSRAVRMWSTGMCLVKLIS